MKISGLHKIKYPLKAAWVMGWTSGIKMFLTLWFKCDVRMRAGSCPESFLVRGGSSDPVVALSVFATQEYLTPYQENIDLILDLGGNVGYSAIYFAHHYPQAHVVVLEPHLGNFRVLEQNVKSYSNITALHAGVWWRDARLLVENMEEDSWGYRFEESTDEGVAGYSMATLISKYGPGKSLMVKMDIEGMEKEIFEKDVSWLKRVRVLQIEIHDCWKSVLGGLNAYDYQAKLSVENLVVDFSSDAERSG